ncbi:calphotin Microtubule-associated protein 4 [Elysia marginata]|uniref:Calphotin Microtubule-associated protein 4 n=1 Tax=Elysia marginata TaxID=1093978 RepID=A0AAV4JYK2_9GAST|nr:calphotin Microtubule-associated protein 4 [Elysia marginata]
METVRSRSSDFNIFIRDNRALLSTRYPFLSQDQILSRLREQWRKRNNALSKDIKSTCSNKTNCKKPSSESKHQQSRPHPESRQKLKKPFAHQNSDVRNSFLNSNESSYNIQDDECEIDSPFSHVTDALRALNDRSDWSKLSESISGECNASTDKSNPEDDYIRPTWKFKNLWENREISQGSLNNKEYLGGKVENLVSIYNFNAGERKNHATESTGFQIYQQEKNRAVCSTIRSEAKQKRPTCKTKRNEDLTLTGVVVKTKLNNDNEYAATQPMLLKSGTPVKFRKSMLQKDGTPVRFRKPMLQKDGTPVGFRKPMLQKDKTPVKFRKPMLQKDGTPVRFRKPMLQKDGTPLINNKPMLKKDETPVRYSKPMLQKDMAPVRFSKPMLQKDGTPVRFSKRLSSKSLGNHDNSLFRDRVGENMNSNETFPYKPKKVHKVQKEHNKHSWTSTKGLGGMRKNEVKSAGRNTRNTVRSLKTTSNSKSRQRQTLVSIDNPKEIANVSPLFNGAKVSNQVNRSVPNTNNSSSFKRRKRGHYLLQTYPTASNDANTGAIWIDKVETYETETSGDEYVTENETRKPVETQRKERLVKDTLRYRYKKFHDASFVETYRMPKKTKTNSLTEPNNLFSYGDVDEFSSDTSVPRRELLVGKNNFENSYPFCCQKVPETSAALPNASMMKATDISPDSDAWPISHDQQFSQVASSPKTQLHETHSLPRDVAIERPQRLKVEKEARDWSFLKDLETTPGKNTSGKDDLFKKPLGVLFQDPTMDASFSNVKTPDKRRLVTSAVAATPSNFGSMFDAFDIFL